MLEKDRVRHILKGIASFAFHALALQNPTTVREVTTTCQRLDDLQSIRIQGDPCHTTHRSDAELRALIRAIIREELHEHGSPGFVGTPHAASAPGLRDIVKEELGLLTTVRPSEPPTPPHGLTYSEIAARPPSMTPSAPAQTPGPRTFMLTWLRCLRCPPLEPIIPTGGHPVLYVSTVAYGAIFPDSADAASKMRGRTTLLHAPMFVSSMTTISAWTLRQPVALLLLVTPLAYLTIPERRAAARRRLSAERLRLFVLSHTPLTTARKTSTGSFWRENCFLRNDHNSS